MRKVIGVSLGTFIFFVLAIAVLKTTLSSEKTKETHLVKSTSEKTEVSNRKEMMSPTEKIQLPDAPARVNKYSESDDPGVNRIYQLAKMVKGTIELDNDTIEKLNDRISALQESIANLHQIKGVHKKRLDKMAKIKSVIGDNIFKSFEPKPELVVAKAEPLKIETKVKEEDLKKIDPEVEKRKNLLTSLEKEKNKENKGLIREINKTFGKKYANLKKVDDGAVLSIDARAILMFDDSRPRVGIEGSQIFTKLVKNFRESYDFEKVIIRVSPNTPGSVVRIVSRFIQRMYGWKPSFEKGESTDSGYEIKIEIISKKGKTSIPTQDNVALIW